MPAERSNQSLPPHVLAATSYTLIPKAMNTSGAGTLRAGRWPAIRKFSGLLNGIALAKQHGGVTKRHLHKLERDGQLRLNTSQGASTGNAHSRRRRTVDVARAAPNRHIVQGGIDNGDKAWLEKASAQNRSARSWIAPKGVAIGDDVVIYIAGYGFFATARIESLPRPRDDWKNRYGAGLSSIKLICPAISLAAIQRRVPKLTWANYPRSITTPSRDIADQIRILIQERRRTGIPDLDDDALAAANIDELRKAALLRSRPFATQKQRKALYRARSRAIHLYVLKRASGRCEGCNALAPFSKSDGSAYLEPHHATRLSDDGPDHPANVIGLCPNCHRRAHYANDAKAFNARLIKRLRALERE